MLVNEKLLQLLYELLLKTNSAKNVNVLSNENKFKNLI